MKFPFIVSDESVNNYGFRILCDGIDTTQFKKNPVGYYMYQRRSGEDYTVKEDEVICCWENLQCVGDVLMSDAELYFSKFSALVRAGGTATRKNGESVIKLVENITA